MQKRLLLADDHAMMLEGLSRLLAEEFEVVGTATNGRTLLEEAAKLQPDIIVLDVGMPELNGIEAARRLRKISSHSRLVFVTQQLDPAYIHAAFTTGAFAYVAKQSAAQELIAAIRLAIKGKYYITPLAIKEPERFPDSTATQNPAEMFGAKLTPRQREVLQLIAEGKSSKEISTSLNISVKTVEFHRNTLMDELGVRSIAELTRYAVSRRIISE